MSDSYSLKETYAAAQKQFAKLSRLSIRPDTNEYQSQVSAVALELLRAQRMVSKLSLFSSNESLDDIQTRDIKYLAIEYQLGVVAERRQPLNPSDPESANDNTSRLDTVKAAIEYYFEFLKNLNNYGLLNNDMIAEPSSSSSDSRSGKVTELSSSSSESNTQSPTFSSSPLVPKRLAATIATGKVSLRDLQAKDPATRRAEKIEQFRREKAVEKAIKAIEERIKSEHTRAYRHKIKGSDTYSSTPTESSSNASASHGDDDSSEEVDYAGADEDTVRTLEFSKLQLMALRSLNALETLNMELEMVSRMPPPSQLQNQKPSHDFRERQTGGAFDKGFTDRVEPKLYSSNGSRRGPLLTPDGKVNRPFTIVGNLAQKVERDQVMNRVRGTGQYAPTMTVEEYLDEEMRRGNIISGGGPKKPLGDDEDEETPEGEDDTIEGYSRLDEKTIKDREWDEFVEANPKGSGNTINRG